MPSCIVCGKTEEQLFKHRLKSMRIRALNVEALFMPTSCLLATTLRMSAATTTCVTRTTRPM
jgi:hypothetical protein